MKTETFHHFDEKSLQDRISEMRVDLIKIRSELASKSSSQKVGQIHQLKKSIARALTAQSGLLRKRLTQKMMESKKKEVSE
ncbi:MAG: 50S ribosomal protein L29 [DPANN group archaeon]|nr:50S ribosomal protein L29 [DPANN group archaeon]